MEFKFGYSALIVLAAAMWGTMGLFSRPLTSMGLGSVEITLTRYVITVVILFIVILFLDRKLFRIKLKDIWIFIGTGICSMLLANTLYCMAQQELSLSLAVVLLYTSPCFVMIFAVIFLKEAMTKQKLTALILAFAGCILCSGIFGAATNFNLYGILLGLGSGIAFSLYTVIGRFAIRKYSAYTMAFYTFLIAGIGILPLSDIGSISAVCGAHQEAIWYILGMGTIVTAIPYFVYYIGLKGTEAGKASVLSFTEPLISTALGFIVYAECPDALGIIGIAMMFVSVVLLSINFSRLRYESVHKRKL